MPAGRGRRAATRTLLVVASALFAVAVMEPAVRALDLPPRPLASRPIPSYRIAANPPLLQRSRLAFRRMAQILATLIRDEAGIGSGPGEPPRLRAGERDVPHG